MRNILIVLFVGLALISVFGYYANLNDGHNLLKKLDKFEKIDNLYYQSQFSFKLMDTQDVEMTVKQFKHGNDYYAQKTSPLSKTVTNLEVKDGVLSFDSGKVIVKGTVEESKADRSIFWLDKLTSNDILPDSIKKIKTPKDFDAGKCDMYFAKLKATMTNFDICINKDNIPVYFKYYGYKNFIPLLFDTNPITNLTKNNGDIVVKISDIRFNPEYDSSFDLPEESNSKEVFEVGEIKRVIERQRSQFDDLNNSIKELKNNHNEESDEDKK